MRIWHEDIIPKLCRQHLLAVWREGLGCYKILTENKSGYRNHPAVKEFEFYIDFLWLRLKIIRDEMIHRGYKPKELPKKPKFFEYYTPGKKYVEWQTFEKQLAVLKEKGCQCLI